MDTRPEPGLVKWSANPNHDTFLHLNILHRVVSLYEPSSTGENTRFPFKQVSKHEEIPPLNTYDWSPTVPGLVAIGTNSGVVNLLRVDDGSNAYLELMPRFHRHCQAVAFSTQAKLAVGLDRVRNDQCLYVWDVNRLSGLDPAVPGFPSDASLDQPALRLEPSVSVSSIKFFEDNPNTLVVGIKAQGLRIHDLRDPSGAVINFQTKCNNNLAIDYANQNYFASSPLDQPTVMIWDRRAGSRTDVRTDSAVQVRAYVEAADAGDVPWGSVLQLNGILHTLDTSRPDKSSFVRSLRYCRDHAGMLGILSRTGQLKVVKATAEFAASEYERCTGPELLRVRKSHEMDPTYLDPSRKNKDDIVSFDWATLSSPALRPRMVILRASGKFELMEKPVFTAHHTSAMIPWTVPHRGLEGNANDLGNRQYHSLVRLEQPHHTDMLGPLLVENVLAGGMVFGGENRKLMKRAVRSAMTPQESRVDLIMDSMAGKATLPGSFAESPAVAEKLRALRTHSLTANATTITLPTSTGSDYHRVHAHLHESLRAMSLSTNRNGPPSSREVHENLVEVTMNPAGLPKEAQCVVDHTKYLRAQEMYLFDYNANKKIASEDPWLQNLWEWLAGKLSIDLADIAPPPPFDTLHMLVPTNGLPDCPPMREGAESAAVDGGMISHPLVLDYLGVYNIWANDLGRKSSCRLYDSNAADPDAAMWERCLGQVAKKQRLPRFEGTPTKWPHHRQVCLAMCQWGHASVEEADDQLSASERLFAAHTRATAQALFRGDAEGAIQILKTASSEHPELLFVSLALQLIKRGDLDMAKQQLDFDERVASKTDPYLRAISSLIATGDWATIVDQDALPLRDRVFVAVRYFGDDQLGNWLKEQVSLAVDKGDVDGVVLTGVSDRLVDIFSKYVEKFGDYQTATLVLSICSPRYIDDHRCKAWRNAYRAYLQRNRAFYSRAKFEVESTKKSKRDGQPIIKPPFRQIALRCIYCDAEVALHGQHAMGPMGPMGINQSNPLMGTSISAGISCWSCGRHLPRCVVCLEVIGIPRSERLEVAADHETRLAGRFPTFCLKCEHVLHLDHAREWFARHVECPVPECRCRCNFRANPELNYH
ncbi:WD repeat domain-containing protein [Zalerion maritima]|uniref:WD repeat domain-containing protein n=1 Tax=Zalerion maritima TaxID=339359 RepID=A0AAD5WWE5_9PEZI|nr:WD repeat domain-containing protein [Zalerion maritima]